MLVNLVPSFPNFRESIHGDTMEETVINSERLRAQNTLQNDLKRFSIRIKTVHRLIFCFKIKDKISLL
jgi:hypothetical protein